MPPFLGGGEMIRDVRKDGFEPNELPWKFEAGTPAIAEAVGMGAAIDYLEAVGLDDIERHEQALTAYALERLSRLDDLHVIGPLDRDRGGAISFTFAGIHPHDIAHELDRYGVCVRAGNHCTQPAMKRFGITASTRASFYLYTLPEEIDRLCDGLEKVRETYAR
jgi:cysteine desulfurase/selenocysteine lyase